MESAIWNRVVVSHETEAQEAPGEPRLMAISGSVARNCSTAQIAMFLING
jgi:hypothetical protein